MSSRRSPDAARTIRQWPAALLALLAGFIASDAVPAERGSAAITWGATIELARGGGIRGPWQQNDSRYDYVDDPTVAIAASGETAVAWVDQARKDIFFQVFERNGKRRLSQPVNVSRTPQVFSWLPRIVLTRHQPRDVYVLCQEIVFSGGSHGGDIFFSRSRDGGTSFEKPLNLSNSIGGDGKGRINKDIWHNGSLDLAIGADGTLHAAWTEYDGPLWFSRSTDRGATFSKPLQVAGGGNGKPARAPALAAGRDGSVYLAWTVGEEEGADIRLARSMDAGRTFGPTAVVAKTSAYSDAPKIAVDSRGTLHIVHAESASGPFDRYDIHYIRSYDGGQTFQPARELSKPQPQANSSAAFPALSVDDKDNLYVVWELYRDRREPPRGLAVSVSRDRGNTFSTPAVVPDSVDAHGGYNGSLQGLLMRKLAASGAGEVAVVNSSFKSGARSRAWLTRGELR